MKSMSLWKTLHVSPQRNCQFLKEKENNKSKFVQKNHSPFPSSLPTTNIYVESAKPNTIQGI